MVWHVELHDDFALEFGDLSPETQDRMLVSAKFLAEIGPRLGRPWVDTLKGSRFSNMKELRVTASDGEWRVAFAFDHARQAILLVAGNKQGMAERLFYRKLLATADSRFEAHLKNLEK
jgi:hypothetical protein